MPVSAVLAEGWGKEDVFIFSVSAWSFAFPSVSSVFRSPHLCYLFYHFFSELCVVKLHLNNNPKYWHSEAWANSVDRQTGDQEVAGSTSPRSATFFRGDWSWNIFYGHSFPSADSRRAVVSFWRKNVHNTGPPHRGLSLPSKREVR